MPSQPTQETLNPCICISLKAGSATIAILDVIFGILYLFRIMYLKYLLTAHHEFFLDEIPLPTNSDFLHWMYLEGNYILMIICGIVLLYATLYLVDHYGWLLVLCNLWLILRAYLIVSFIIFSKFLFNAKVVYYKRLAIELLSCALAQFYCCFVVIMFLKECKLDTNNKRAIKPLVIAKEEHETYLTGKPNKFNNAMSFHILTPHYFLHSGKMNPEDEVEAEDELKLSNLDESMLQYVAGKSRVEVISEAEAMREYISERGRIQKENKDGHSSDVSELPNEERLDRIPTKKSASDTRYNGSLSQHRVRVKITTPEVKTPSRKNPPRK